jgi:hypothetical protein
MEGLPRAGFRKAQLAFACLREAPPPEALRRAGASAKAGPFLSNRYQIFSPTSKHPFELLIPSLTLGPRLERESKFKVQHIVR